MNWDDLRIFLAVARERSMNRAGQRLDMHHTNVARRMRRFEERLGTRLITRGRVGHTLTRAGEQLFEQAVAMEEQAHAIERSIVGLDVSLTGTVRFTAHQDFFDALVAHRLKAFHTRYPGICLEVATTSRVLDLDTREADIALRLTSNPDGHLVGRRIAPMVMGVYCSAAYRPAPGEPVKVVLFRRQTELPGWVREHFADAVVSIRVDSLRSAQAALREGLGIASLPCFYADQDPRLRRLDLDYEAEPFDIWLLNHADVRASARVRACWEWLVQILEAQRDLLMGRESRWLETPLHGG